ncbi:phosphomannomutase [Psychrobacter frigidicola]|uniref:phosphomannomutase n=1 Tax=Psychrobacter frigidicola TaxID=45611 RepID=UPI001D0FCBE7|nr:phosphomannomutase [Psychrobacter frigidicola]
MKTIPPFAAQQSLFRAYDIRGDRRYFTSKFIQALGEAFADLYKSQKVNGQDKNAAHDAELASNYKPAFNYKPKTIVIGYDVRCNSDTIAQTLASILYQRGLQVIRLGLITTPMMAFWAEQYDGHGLMVTASHSAKDTLGVKWLVGHASPSSADIQALYQQLQVNNYQDDSKAQNIFLNSSNVYHNDSVTASLSTDTVMTTYINAIAQVFTRIHQHHDKATVDNSNPVTKTISKLNLTIVIDCLNGATSKIAPHLFEHFCKRVIMLNDTPDGNFPTGNPDPTEPNRLAELQQTVIVNEADIGLAFDGDGDRLMIVDNSGKVVTADHLLYLLAQVALTERPESIADPESAPQVLFDIKCSHHLPKLLKLLGAHPVMTRTGSSLMRQQLQSYESSAIFVGELSGHFIFNDGYFITYDDAMYAGLRLLHWLAYTATYLNVEAPLNTAIDMDTSIETVLITSDLWGKPRPVLPPYQLTDITRSLPTLVSTADHYLPLTENVDTNCTAVAHLAELCRYLQRLVNNNAKSKGIAVKANKLEATAVYKLSSCTCFMTGQHIMISQAQQLLPAGTKLSCIDGVRLDFAHGFGVVRQSNTSHSLTVRFAGDSVAALKDVQARFVTLCRSFDESLATRIATIYPE